MKSSPVYSPFTALTLKVVGLIMIVSALLDFIILALPFNALQRPWQLNVTTQLVDRGIVPMVGIALLVAGYWIGNSIGVSSEPRSSWQDLRFWAFLLSSLLGLIFLLLVPLHFNNVRLQSDENIKQIEQRADQAETQIDARAQQISAQIKDPKGLAQLKQQLSELDQAISSGRVPQEQLTQAQAYKQLLQSLTQDPNKAIGQELEAAKNKLRDGKLTLENRAKTEAWKSGLKTGLSSMLLAIGYIVIGWTGLRSLGDSLSRR
jgi:hypothetical protein